MKKQHTTKRSSHRYALGAGLIITLIGVLASANAPLSFFNLTGLIIVVGGILSAVFVSYSVDEVKRAIHRARTLKKVASSPLATGIEQIFTFTALLRRNNLRAAEQFLERVNDPLIRGGLQAVLDRESLPDIHHQLQWRLQHYKADHLSSIKLFHSMALYAPAFGMVGTLVGLVNMMLVIETKSFDLVSANLGVALVTTFYGLLLANLLFKPIAIRLEKQMDNTLEQMRLLGKGVLLAAEGKSPALIKDNLLMLATLDQPPGRSPEPPGRPLTSTTQRQRTLRRTQPAFARNPGA